MSKLVLPYFVQFHAYDAESGDRRAYAFLVTTEGEQDEGETDAEQVSGFVFVNDADNAAARAAGLTSGVNGRPSIGRGGPGSNVSWSPYEGTEVEPT